MSDAPLTIAVFGQPAQDTLERVGAAAVNLVNAVGKEMGTAVGWRVSRWLRRCDSCGHQQPFCDPSVGWANDGRYDLCERCALEAAR